MANVLIADDHPMVRTGLRALLAESPGLDTISEAGSGTETLAMLPTGRWDLLILDLSMPDRSGTDILREVRAGFPSTKVLVLSAFPERQYALTVIKAGANGYLPKECAPKELLNAVRTVLQGRRYVSVEIAQQLVTDIDQDVNRPLHARLSGREFQIFCRLAAGCSVTSISDELLLSVKTVSTYRSRVLEKMSLGTNADMTMYAVRHDLIQGAAYAEPVAEPV